MEFITNAFSRASKWARGVKEGRVLFWGLDAAGKTTILYYLKLGEVVTTIPTIGFNVETIKTKNIQITAWDVGGCDKIRPLWRHYMAGTNATVFVVDSNDRDRIGDARDELALMMKEDEVRGAPVLVFANKQDLPNAMSVEEVVEKLNLREALRGQPWHVQPATATHGEGIHEGLAWLADQIKLAEQRQRASGSPSAGTAAQQQQPQVNNARHTTSLASGKGAAGKGASAAYQQQYGRTGGPTQDQILLQKLQGWLDEPDQDSDEEFLAALEGCTLTRWDHYAHLRIAWAYLTCHGRCEGLRRIFASIQNYIADGPATRGGATYHETMTYFWSHMVHYALASAPADQQELLRSDFKSFLRASPHLADGGLFLKYYSRQLMLHSPEARKQMALPDLQQLPSLISLATSASLKATATNSIIPAVPDTTPLKSQATAQGVATSATAAAPIKALVSPAAVDDTTFLQAFQQRQLAGWGPKLLPRLAYAALKQTGGLGHTADAQALMRNVLQATQGDAYDEDSAAALMTSIVEVMTAAAAAGGSSLSAQQRGSAASCGAAALAAMPGQLFGAKKQEVHPTDAQLADSDAAAPPGLPEWSVLEPLWWSSSGSSSSMLL